MTKTTFAALSIGAMISVGLVSPAQAAANVHIPKGFLLFESKTARKQLEGKGNRLTWTTSNRRNQLMSLDPCDNGKPTDAGREAARTINADGVIYDAPHSEQLIVYRNTAAAKAAINGLRSQLRRCAVHNRFTYATKRMKIGDEAFLVKGFFVASGITATVMRQGRALSIYTFPNYPQGWPVSEFPVSQAKRMAAKLAHSCLD